MKVTFSRTPKNEALLIYPLFEKEDVRDAELKKILRDLASSHEFEAKACQSFYLVTPTPKLSKRILLVGCGDEKKLNVTNVMSIFGSAIQAAQRQNGTEISIILHPLLHDYAQSIMEAIMLANHQPGRLYKTGENLKKIQLQSLEEVEFVGIESNKKVKAAIEKAVIVADTENMVRDWVNSPPNIAHVEFFEEKARQIAKQTGSKLTILKKKDMERLGMGALLAVNRGSAHEARLICIDYAPDAKTAKEAPIVLVGKGIIFDTGGYNMKPSGAIMDMHLDKSGAAAVIATILLAHKLGIKKHIVAVAPMTDNVVGPNSYMPSDVIKTYSGKTVEITNTDAEGRLVLCDAIAYAVDMYHPKYLIDIATLTGACMVALGERYAGLFGNDTELKEKIRAAGEATDELMWELPIHDDFAEKMKGRYTDLQNAEISTEKFGGASKGAAFIRYFVGDTKWAHIDIAGPAFVSDPKKYEHRGATGFPIRALAHFLEQ
ncbi:leucyl aminopeptidase [Candidatus Gracilibacteria bacterium]|nr:leucyl aminopeptidase [Candidatus Gracilibacteria bacterium]